MSMTGGVSADEPVGGASGTGIGSSLGGETEKIAGEAGASGEATQAGQGGAAGTASSMEVVAQFESLPPFGGVGACTQSIWMPMYFSLGGLDDDVFFTGITLTHTGTGPVTSIAEVDVLSGGFLMGATLDPKTDRVRVLFDEPFFIPGGQPWGFTVYAWSDGTAGEQHAFQVTAADDIEFQGNVFAEGDFPARGGPVATFTDDLSECAWLYTMLAQDTPPGLTLPKGASAVELLKVDLPNDNRTALLNPMHVTRLRIKRVGVGVGTAWSNLYLLDNNGARLTTGRLINPVDDSVTFNGLDIVIPDDTTTSVMLVGDVSDSAVTGDRGAFEVTSEASVTFTGQGLNRGVFPARGNTFTIGGTSAAELQVQKGSQPADPHVGSDAVISNFTLTAGTDDMQNRRVTLLQSGSVLNTDLSNLGVYEGSTLVASGTLFGDKIVLTFDPAFLISSGQTKSVSLHARVTGPAGRTIRTSIEYPADVYAVDSKYGTTPHINISGANGFDGADPSRFIEVTTQDN